LDAGLRLDFVIDREVVVELKSVERVLDVHQAQMLTYLKLTGCPIGLLINFNVPVLTRGIRRFINSAKE
jgi:GxxExxY protein